MRRFTPLSSARPRVVNVTFVRTFTKKPGEAIVLRSVADKVKHELAAKCAAIKTKYGEPPCLAVILVGDRKDSEAYVRNKKKACEEVGIRSVGIDLPASTPQAEIMAQVKRLDNDPSINGILVQLPLPKGIDHRAVLECISPVKDVDGLTGMSHGHLFIHGIEAGLVPCTPLGVMRLLEDAKISLEGKNAVVLGRSNLVGKPLALLFLSRNATVTVAHSKTKNLKEVLRSAEILVAAIGQPQFVKGDMVQPGAVVIDVGINAVPAADNPKGYKLVGDVDYEACKKVASAITPVPGGVGPMTVAMLISNTVRAWELQYPGQRY